MGGGSVYIIILVAILAIIVPMTIKWCFWRIIHFALRIKRNKIIGRPSHFEAKSMNSLLIGLIPQVAFMAWVIVFMYGMVTDMCGPIFLP